MHQILKTAAISLTVFTVAASASAQRQWTVTGQEVSGFAVIDEMIRGQMMQHDISASSVAITKNGRLVYTRGYTWDRPDVEPVQPTSLFRTGSIAKSITSIAIHQLIEDGLLSYDTRVAETLGLEPPPGRSADPWLDLVTVDHLLTHTVGWDKYDGGIDPMVFRDLWVALSLGVLPPPTRHEIATFMTGEPFQFEPGTRWAYCNFGYLLLQMLAEQVTGVDFPEYVHDNIFRPIGVGRARMAHSPRADLAPTERHYVGDYEGDPYSMGWENAYAAGGMVLSAPDLARLYSALFDDPNASGLLRSETVDSMLSLPFEASRDMGYGRGWIFEKFFVDMGKTMGGYIDLNDNLQVYSHGGGGPGVHAIAAWRSDGFGFFWVSNKDPLVDDFDDLLEIDGWPAHNLWQSVGISRDPVGSAPVESWVPAVAHTTGVGDSIWRSDVGLLNRSTQTNAVRLRYYNGWDVVERELELAPGESQVIPDAVDWFGRTGFGPLQVFSSEALTVTSRTFNQSTVGTFGQSLDGVTATGGLESGESVVLMQLREDDEARTNIGILNQWRGFARVGVELYDDNGSLVQDDTWIIPPLHTVQVNRPYATFCEGANIESYATFCGRVDIESGYAVIKVRSGQDIYVYGSVIDNATGDPTAIPMKGGNGSSRQWIAAAAHSGGAHGSVWRTDVCLLNRSSGTATAELRFRRSDGDAAALVVEVADGEQVVVRDVVSEMGMSGSGSIEVFSDRPLFASSRTYNASVDGSFGLFLDGVPVHAAARAGDIVWLPQLQQNAAFRTNIGLLNTGDIEARVRVFLYDASGNELISRWRTLEPSAWMQLQEPFARLAERSDIESGTAVVEIASGHGVIAYASVIDNATNDGTAISMKR
jgi:CubicO group peptidase (beta-lactamase class C family)